MSYVLKKCALRVSYLRKSTTNPVVAPNSTLLLNHYSLFKSVSYVQQPKIKQLHFKVQKSPWFVKSITRFSKLFFINMHLFPCELRLYIFENRVLIHKKPGDFRVLKIGCKLLLFSKKRGLRGIYVHRVVYEPSHRAKITFKEKSPIFIVKKESSLCSCFFSLIQNFFSFSKCRDR